MLLLLLLLFGLHITITRYRRLTFQLYVTQCTQKEGVLHPPTAPSDAWTMRLVKSRPTSVWFCVKRSTWSSETALGSCSSCVALIRRGDSSLFVATPEVNPSAPSPDRKVQTSGRTSSNKSDPARTLWLRPKMASSVRWPAYTYPS